MKYPIKFHRVKLHVGLSIQGTEWSLVIIKKKEHCSYIYEMFAKNKYNLSETTLSHIGAADADAQSDLCLCSSVYFSPRGPVRRMGMLARFSSTWQNVGM